VEFWADDGRTRPQLIEIHYFDPEQELTAAARERCRELTALHGGIIVARDREGILLASAQGIAVNGTKTYPEG
jgi:hypothetical protein